MGSMISNITLQARAKRRGRSAARLCLATLVIVVSAGCSEQDADSDNGAQGFRQRSNVTHVVTQAIVEQSLIETIQAVGTARALHSVVLYPEAAGIVRAVHLSANTWVDVGDTLLELDNRDERLALELAEVQLADAERLVRRATNRSTLKMPILQKAKLILQSRQPIPLASAWIKLESL